MKKQKKRKWLDALMLLAIIVGIGVFCYPFFSNALNSFLDQQLVSYYQSRENKKNEETVQKLKEETDRKNEEIKKKNNPGLDQFNKAVAEKKVPVKPEKSYFEQHTAAVLTIPKLSISLPVFDETNDVLLQKGAAVLDGTSLPGGGKSTHSVISAHRGLPEAKLFTDLPEMKKGDQFFIDVHNERLAYEVDQIKVIEPTETDDLLIQEGKDLVTLMTCTPYMVNSHRLLVRGHRVPYEKKNDEKIKKVTQFNQRLLFFWIAGAALAVLLLLLFFRKRRKKRHPA